MIDLYISPTPHGGKTSIPVEEVTLPSAVEPLQLGELERNEDWKTLA